MRELAAVLGRVEEVPGEVLRQATDAFAWRRVAAALAEIAYDSALDADDGMARVRAGGSDRRLTFQAPHVTVEVSISEGARTMVGQLHPAEAGSVELRDPDQRKVLELVEVDASGAFLFDRVPRGAVSLRFTGESRGMDFETEWVTL